MRKDIGKVTPAFESFDYDLEQSFLIADILSRAGTSVLKEKMNDLTMLAQKVTGFDATALNKMTDDERVKACERASDDDVAQITQLKEEAEKYLSLGRDTVPNILFIFLITKFEAYIEDIVISLGQVKPSLISLSESASEDEIREKAESLIAHKRIDEICNSLFEQRFNIPISKICLAAKTSPKEIDKAKAIRNIHIHNRGLVNKRNVSRIGAVNLNHYYSITLDYLKDIKDKIYLLCLGIDKTVSNLYPDILNASSN